MSNTPPLRVAWRREVIAARVAELGAEITTRYAGQPLVLVGLLNGATVFLADLLRHVELDARVDFLSLRPRPGGDWMDERGGVAPVLFKDLDIDISGQAVLLVSDVVHRGATLAQVSRLLAVREPTSLRVCALLDRPAAHTAEVALDHVAFTVGAAPMVGYGLELGGMFCALPDLWEVTDELALRQDPEAARKMILSAD